MKNIKVIVLVALAVISSFARKAHTEPLFQQKDLFISGLDGVNIYHSGGCILYKGLIEKVRTIGADIALLPISGQNFQEKEKKIARNFMVEEALDLCEGANIKNLIVHHFGMFSHDTVSADDLANLKNMNSKSFHIIIPEINRVYKIMK